jgi:hypothetical protein
VGQWLAIEPQDRSGLGFARNRVERTRAPAALGRTANLGARDAGLLGVSEGVAGLRIERVSYLPSGRVVEFTRSLYRGDAYDFAVELKLAPDHERTTP